MSDTATILRKARDHIAQPGMWWQNRYYKGLRDNAFPSAPRPCCPLGAVGLAVGTHPDAYNREYNKAVKLLRLALGDIEDGIPDWNDAPGRTQAEVVALFDRAIELAEKEAAS